MPSKMIDFMTQALSSAVTEIKSGSPVRVAGLGNGSGGPNNTGNSLTGSDVFKQTKRDAL